MKANVVKTELRKHSDKKRAAVMQRFFKTRKGQYGEGDIFIGISVPDIRKVTKSFAGLPLAEVQKLLDSPVHEDRLAGVIILVGRYPKAAEKEKQQIYDFYMKNVYSGRINNWDIVDVTTPNIVGEHLADRPKDVLNQLAVSDSLWQKRVAIMATFAFIKRGNAAKTVEIAEILLNDKHDLIHKAVGWMLREAGKRADEKILTGFLDQHAAVMPSTMLRYAIEKLTPAQKLYYMGLKRAGNT